MENIPENSPENIPENEAGDALLHVVTAALDSASDPSALLLALRRIGSLDDGNRLTLLFCDWTEDLGEHLPGDDLLLRSLQSGVMALDAQAESRFALLVRRRVYSAAQGLYVSASQQQPVQDAMAQLLREGSLDTPFDAATVSPGFFKGCFSAVLFSDIALSCTPDTPRRMAQALSTSGAGCLCAHILPCRVWPQSALARLGDFSLSAPFEARACRLVCQGLASVCDHPSIFSVRALTHGPLPETAPLAEGCFFIRRHAPVLSGCFRQYAGLCRRQAGLHLFLPLLQTALLFGAAISGLPFPAFLAIALAEHHAILHPRFLSHALLRTALIPAAAFLALHSLLSRLLARTQKFRLLPPGPRFASAACVLAGAALLPPALRTAYALVPILFVCLLWLSAPLILPALDKPTIERIPISPEQTAELRHLAESAFFDMQTHAHPQAKARSILAACAGSMLGLLEPDEAARRAEALLAQLSSVGPLSAVSHASLLVSAQYLRSHMSACDASLRSLPMQLEAFSRQSPLAAGGRLGALLHAARSKAPAPDALHALQSVRPHDPLESLFLPLGPARSMAQHPITLPLTHPHTFLHRERICPGTAAPADTDPEERFLALAAAVLGHPFFSLLAQSPTAGPYMPLLSI